MKKQTDLSWIESKYRNGGNLPQTNNPFKNIYKRNCGEIMGSKMLLAAAIVTG